MHVILSANVVARSPPTDQHFEHSLFHTQMCNRFDVTRMRLKSGRG